MFPTMSSPLVPGPILSCILGAAGARPTTVKAEKIVVVHLRLVLMHGHFQPLRSVKPLSASPQWSKEICGWCAEGTVTCPN